IHVLLEDFPVVDAGLPWRSGVEHHKAFVHFSKGNRDGLATDSACIEMHSASTFCAITRICSIFSLRLVKRARAALVAIIRAEEPEMPAPAGDSENVSSRKPLFGLKKRTR